MDRRSFLIGTTAIGALMVAGNGLAMAQEAEGSAPDLAQFPRNETVIVHNPEGVIRNPGWFNLWANGGGGLSTGLQQLTADTFWYIDPDAGIEGASENAIYYSLAEGPWEYNDDFSEMTVRLRKGIMWSDGVEFTADDVVFTVEKQAATGPVGDGGEEIDFLDSAFFEQDIGRGVFQQHPAAHDGLDFVDMVAHALQGCSRIRHRQKVVVIGRIVGRPSQMLGKKARLITGIQRLQTLQMIPVERSFTADGQAHTVQRHRIIAADRLQLAVRYAACPHVVLRMHLEEPDFRPGLQDLCDMLPFKSRARKGGNVRGDARKSSLTVRAGCHKDLLKGSRHDRRQVAGLYSGS